MADVQELILAGADERDLARLDEYRAVGGYGVLERARGMSREAVIEEISNAALRGRGGAGFPMGRKLSLVQPPEVAGKPTYVVANADESEPGSFKDREIMRRVPHRFIEGCLIAAHAIGSKNVFIYIRGEYVAEYEVLKAAADEVRDAGLLGDVVLVIHRGAGAYICGEETALLDSLEGKRGQPRPRPPFPPVAGLYGAPTLINNVQTLANVPVILDMGVAEYKKIGPESSPGTVVYSLSGNVERPGNYELPLGTTLRELIYDVGGGIPGGRSLKAIIPGGSSVPVFTPDEIDTPADFDSIQAAGSFLGSAAIIVVDDRACMVQLALRAEKFYMHESCGKCTPCREGTRWMVRLLEKIESGRAEHSDLDLLRGICNRIEGRSLCALGDFAVWPVRELHRQVPGRVRGAHRRGRLPVRRRVLARRSHGPDRPAHAQPGRRGARMRHDPVQKVTVTVTVTRTGLRMSAAETVTVVVDGREIQVPKGTGLVETALAAGIEIPVFCYEPRLGPPVGACRMCLVEVEGMPKLQAGCTLTATDGMVVKTAQTSQLAADGQNSTLEFILVNHPLDCPVCDKGGECPLQDLTFRWGPPVTRNTFPKRTFEKPIPISPTIALDRERCILCYRCTRFSSDVAEDSQLIARDRGSQSVIATFEDEPYSAPFSGNVIELCPVGALTSTQYRFEARPWEIQDVPTVCGMCPVGCNVDATTREGKVKRVVSRNHPEVDEGWLCDKGRFGFSHLRAGDRASRSRPQGRSPPLRDDLLGRGARRGRGAAARGGEEHRHRAFRLGDRRAGVRPRQAAPRRAGRSLRGDAGGRQPRPRRVPPAAVCDSRRGTDRDPRRRPRRRARADRRPLGQGRAPRGRRGGRERDRRRRRGRGQGPERARRQDPLDRADDPHLVGPERERRRARRIPRRRARPRRQARQRRVPPPGDRERPRGRRRLGGRGRRRGGRPGADRAPDRLRATKRRRTRTSAPSPTEPGASWRSRCSARPCAAGATSSYPERATSSATARTSTSRAGSNACAAP